MVGTPTLFVGDNARPLLDDTPVPREGDADDSSETCGLLWRVRRLARCVTRAKSIADSYSRQKFRHTASFFYYSTLDLGFKVWTPVTPVPLELFPNFFHPQVPVFYGESNEPTLDPQKNYWTLESRRFSTLLVVAR